MNFGLTPIEPRKESALEVRQPSEVLDFQNTPQQYSTGRGEPANRIAKSQIICQRCGKEVEKTAQTGFQAGRRIIVCAFYCHGEMGEIRICEDQLTMDMEFKVFTPAIQGVALPEPPPKTKRAALPKKSAAPEVIEVEAEVMPPQSTPAECPGENSTSYPRATPCPQLRDKG